MNPGKREKARDFTGCRVLILADTYAGCEGVCVGKAACAGKWAISPDGTDEVVLLIFDKEFGLLMDQMDPSGDPEKN